ncbi:hypothetical protein DFH11DRAFT_843473 [Phellopilus nigrolimitatus]|nr:hypothetical protein DFH11DRAFT_843473 [Phellopilus nigrolimitatus]
MAKKGRKPAKEPSESSLDSPPGVTVSFLGLTFGPVRPRAASPFNDSAESPDTVVFLSGDDVEFYLSKIILSIASPLFRSIIASKGNIAPHIRFTRENVDGHPAIRVQENSTILDALFRFIYPFENPVFEAPLTQCTPLKLPFRLIGPIHDAAQKYGLEQVCNDLLLTASSIVRSTASSTSALFIVLGYGVACRLNLGYDLKKTAAYNSLRLPLNISPFEALDGEGVSNADIISFDNYHKQTYQACYNLLAVDPSDAYATGFPDAYAYFLACSHCAGVPSEEALNSKSQIRGSAARWWQVYTTKALEVLRRAPLSPEIFHPGFLKPMYQEAQKCKSCAEVVHWKWSNMYSLLIQLIPNEVNEVVLNVNRRESELDEEVN